MAYDCYLKKLECVASNDNLKELGVLEVGLAHLSSSSAKRLNIINNKPFDIWIKGSGKFYTDSTKAKEVPQPIHANAGSKSIFIDGTGSNDILLIGNKYSITKFQTEDGGTITGKIDTAFLEKMQNWDTFNSNCIVNYNVLTQYTKDLTRLYSIDNRGVSGSIETIVENILGLGRNEGTLTLSAYVSDITLNNVRFFTDSADRTKSMTITFGNNTATCTWKGNTVASYDGSTWTYA